MLNIARWKFLITICAVMVLAAIGLWGYAPVVQAQNGSDSLPRTITVVGEGKVRIQPDVARANFGVEVVRGSVREALSENKATMDAVLAALAELEIAEKDIQTTGFSIYAERYGPTGPLPEDQVNYRVSNNVSVLIRDLENVGNIVDATVEAGANNINGIEFRVDDPSSLEAEARKNAIENAKAKATDLAGLADVTLGEVVSVSEVISSGGYYASNFAQGMGLGGGGGATPITPGELELNLQLQVTYAIAR